MYQRIKRASQSLKSENWAGIISLLGSSALVLNGGVSDILAAMQFTAAEIGLARYGHKSAGYSISAGLFSAGDLTLAFSKSVPEGSLFQYSLFAMAGAWGVGALKHPFEKVAEKSEKPSLAKLSNHFPTICSTSNLLLRIPGVVSAAQSQNFVAAGAIAAWGISDVLAGRLQERAKSIYDYCKIKP